MARSWGTLELSARNPDPHHEVAVVELLGLEQPGLAATDAGAALGIEAHPAHPAAQVGAIDGVEPGLGVDVEDAAPHVQRVVVLLHAFVDVERLAHAEGPLALAARLAAVGVRRRAPDGRVPAGGSVAEVDAVGADMREVLRIGRRRRNQAEALRQPGDRARAGATDQAAGRHAALETRSKSTCRRATSRSVGMLTRDFMQRESHTP